MIKDLVNQCEPLPSNSKLLILGAGFSGQHVANLAKQMGANVICSRRKEGTPGADCIFDSTKQKIPSEKALSEVTHVLSCIPPDAEGEDPVLISLKKELKNMPLQWVGYLSTTGVYGDCKGQWVTESDLPKPQLARSTRRLGCEQAWQTSGLPIQILRLPGIYGPGRSAIENIKAGKTKMIDKPGQVFSRIHIDDIAGAIFHLINLSTKKNIKPTIVNVADNLPSTNIEVMQYAASLMNISLPPIEPFQIAAPTMSSMALSFWQENRKVSNNKLCNELGYRLIHSDYKSGLKDCWLQNKSNIFSNNYFMN
ncbi:SDR family oxidoreductase [Prochlorococcus sp. MIT 1307]|uniref:SDR family oxidoreductase n=1 Tax=Prochlorococcus sp. MIT 1307 TaxID=3096219 RepID=UPI002A7538E2|nr:SDR family oxidoreductase [Prochlorococcus sp. MIT 1307]